MNAEKHIYDRLIAVFSDAGTVAIMANWFAESGFKSNNLQNSFTKKLGMTDEEYTRAVNDGSYDNFTHDGAGYGLAQWTFWSRKLGLLNYANSQCRSIDDLDMQIDYALIELGQKTSLYKLLRTSSDYALCTVEVLTKYERPADQGEAEQKKRIGYAEELYKKYVKQEEQKMVFNIHAGHNPDGMVACGAIGFIKESTENRNVKNEVIRMLRGMGHTVYDCTVDNGTSASNVLTNIVKKCNAHEVDLDVSIHFNAGASDAKGNGKTTGTEVFVYSANSKAKDEAERVCKAISALGFKNRGVKVNPNLYFLRKVKASAMLIEVCFVDDRDDVALYDCKNVAEAIVYGITGQKYNEPTNNEEDKEADGNGAETATGDASSLYRVQVGAYGKKANAENMQKKLKSAGFDAVIVKN